MKTKVLFTFIFCLISFMVFGQIKFYEMPDKKVFPAPVFKQIENQIIKSGTLVILYDSIVKTDTILYKVGLKPLQKRNNPYQKFKNKIGKDFPLDLFGMKKTEKPIFVNFWFTTCGPCIKEIPELNALKKKYQDKVTFVAITFNTKEQIDTFLAKRPIDFEHITDQRSALTKYGVRGYPMNMILDKDGKILWVDGMINYAVWEVEQTLDYLLEKE